MDLMDPFDLQNLVLELKERIEKLEKKRVGPSEFSPLRVEFLDGYRKEFKRDYPKWGPKENSLMKSWGSSVGIERAKELIGIYFSWNDPFTVRAGHPLELLVTKTVELVAWHDNAANHSRRIATARATEREIIGGDSLLEEMKAHGKRQIRQTGRITQDSDLHGGEIQKERNRRVPRECDE